MSEIPGADHILAQPSKRCSASRIKIEWNVRTCKKEKKHSVWGVAGCAGCAGVWEKEFPYIVAKLQAKSQKPSKIYLFLQFCSEDESFRHGEMKMGLCLYFQHVTRHIGTDFVEGSRQKMQRSEEEHFFGEGCFDRKDYLSNTANKRCSRQVLPAPMFLVIFHQILHVALGDELSYGFEPWAVERYVAMAECSE